MAGRDPFADILDGLRTPATRVLAPGVAWSGATLLDHATRLSDRLDGVDLRRVASRLDNGADWLSLDLALRRLGAVHVPLPTFFSPGQIAHATVGSGAQCIVTGAGSPPPEGVDALEKIALSPTLDAWRLATRPTALPDGTACITYTSGTTGRPRGVCLGAAAMRTVAGSLADAARPLAPRRHLCLMPLSTLLENVAGLYAALLADAEIVVPPLADIGYTGAAGLDVPTLLACLHRHRPESVILLPQLLLALVMAAEQGQRLPDSIRFMAVGGGRVGPRLMARAEALGLPVFEGYGLTECGSVVSLNRPGANRPGSVGQPLPHARVAIVDGEIRVDGVRCLGYLGEAGPPPGAIATGDLGHLDEDGYLHVTGRRKHVFITAFGRIVSPEWVESELLQHPAIAQAIVWGEARATNLAILWPRRADLDDASLARAVDEVNAGLPDYARIGEVIRAPRPFTVADGLMTANGRPRRDAILARHADAIAALSTDDACA